MGCGQGAEGPLGRAKTQENLKKLVLARRPVSSRGLLAMGSDRGLCGACNTAVVGFPSLRNAKIFHFPHKGDNRIVP